MMTYFDLSIPMRSLLLLSFFLVFCVGGCMLTSALKRKKLWPRLLILLGTVISGSLMLLYITEARARLMHHSTVNVTLWLCNQPLLFPLMLLSLIVVCFVYLTVEELQFRRNIITRSSIKEGIDKISSGLCFYQDGGRIILVNRRMNALCFAIAGKDLQNAELFWRVLSGGEVLPDVERLSFGNYPSFRLTDGRVWSFSYENLNGIHQLSAADTTQIQAVTDELKSKNIELAALNLRLRKHGENVDELTRAKERLETKTRIHSELGQALLSTRRFLVDEDGSQAVPLEVWKRNIAMLRKEAELKEKEQPLEMLARIAVSTGIAIELDGEIPPNEKVQELFVRAAAEALTNAISHAKAKTLYIQLGHGEHAYTARLTNDGSKPDGEIIEGGGLGSLRKKIEREGGTMQVAAEPEFMLTITLPKESGDTL